MSASRPPRRSDASWLVALSIAGIAVLAVDLTALALSAFTVGLPALLVTSQLRRSLADVHRTWADRVLGTSVARPYRPAPDRSPARRAITTMRDAATYRDLLWLAVNAVAGTFLALLSVVLLLGGVFWLVFPFLWWVTPAGTFATNFGIYHVGDQAGSFAVLPLGLVALALWWFASPALLRVDARLARALLHPRHDTPTRDVVPDSTPTSIYGAPAAGSGLLSPGVPRQQGTR